MKLVIQRVNQASVTVNSKIVGEIGKGMLILVGISNNYNEKKLDWMVNKVLNLRLWSSEQKGFDLNIKQIGGEILVVSQFTLFGDVSEGHKPKFNDSMQYEQAKPIYDQFVTKLKESGIKVETGEFGAMMDVKLENNGPVTIVVEK